MNTLHKKNSKGFTLVETLVSLAIFSSAIVGMIVVTSQGINDTNYAKNKLVATALSQEGIEIVRNIRDSALLSDTTGTQGWATFISAINPCLSMACAIDPLYTDISSLTIVQCTADDECILSRDELSSSAYYETTGNDDSSYSRFIQINELTDGNTVEIISTVEWTQGSGSKKEVVSKEYLTNWFVNSVTP